MELFNFSHFTESSFCRSFNTSSTKKSKMSMFMVIRLKDAIIDSIEDTETKKLKLIKISSKINEATLELELPEALCERLDKKDTISIVIDEKPIASGTSAKLYMQGSVFKIDESDGLEVVGTMGGLRLVFALSKATPAKRKTFMSDSFYISLT